MRVRYTGSAGYVYTPKGADPFVPVPGQVLDLDDALVATLGAEFEPVDGEQPFDPATAKKADLIAHADAIGVDVDPSAPVADIRAALAADTTAPADGATPTGQEG